MRELEIQGVSRRRGRVRTTTPDKRTPPAPDLVNRDFAADRRGSRSLDRDGATSTSLLSLPPEEHSQYGHHFPGRFRPPVAMKLTQSPWFVNGGKSDQPPFSHWLWSVGSSPLDMAKFSVKVAT